MFLPRERLTLQSLQTCSPARCLRVERQLKPTAPSCRPCSRAGRTPPRDTHCPTSVDRSRTPPPTSSPSQSYLKVTYQPHFLPAREGNPFSHHFSVKNLLFMIISIELCNISATFTFFLFLYFKNPRPILGICPVSWVTLKIYKLTYIQINSQINYL